MIAVICMALMSGFVGGPASFLGFFGYIMCILPFMADMLISMRGAYNALTQDPQGATVEELVPNANEENFLREEDKPEANGPPREEAMVDPATRLMPSALAEIEPFNNLMTSNWKENAA